MSLEGLARVRLGNFPTPLEEMKRLSARLGGPRLFIKRDDLTGLALGGNKTRNLEFTLGDAVDKGADMVITTAGLQSNWARQTTAAANRLGMKPVLVLKTAQFGEAPTEWDGNLLLDRIMGAEVRVVKAEVREDIRSHLEKVAEEYRSKGHRPYLMPGESPLAVFGHFNAIREIKEQLSREQVRISHIIHATGGGSTQAGLMLGTKAFNLGAEVVGVNVGAWPRQEVAEAVEHLATEAVRRAELDLTVSPKDVKIVDDYVFGGYGKVSSQVVDAIELVGKEEGILLDPVYSGKAMSGLIDMVRNRMFEKTDTILFIHTGGIPALFPYRGIFGKPQLTAARVSQ